MSEDEHLGLEGEHSWEGAPLVPKSQMAAITELQDSLNRHLLTIAEVNERYKPPPMTRRRKATLKWRLFKYRTSSRWRRMRRTVAIWIAPELDDW